MKHFKKLSIIAASVLISACYMSHEGEVYSGGEDIILDNQNKGDANKWIALYGDMGRGSSSQQRLAEHGARWNETQPLDAVIFVGDNIYSEDPYEIAGEEKLFKPMASLFNMGVSIHAILGNHDHSDGHAVNQMNDERLGMNGNQYYRLKDEEGFYSFYMLDSEVIEYDEAQRKWLEDTLANDDSHWLICVIHVPPYASDVSHDDAPAMQRIIESTASKTGKNFDLILSGHNHIFERRLVPRKNALMIIQGSSGRNSTYADWPEDELRLAYYDIEESYTMLEFSDEYVSGTTVNDLGTIVDTFVFDYPDN